MQIEFSKIRHSIIPFNFKKDNVKCHGKLERLDRQCVRCEALIEGEMTLYCDRCGASYTQIVKLPLDLRLCDGAVKGSDELDTIEFFDAKVDLSALVESELASIEGNYHYCPECSESNEILSIEY